MRKRDRWELDPIDLSEPVKSEKPKGKISRFSQWLREYWKKLLIVVALIYALLLTYGLVTTRYYTDENGTRHAYALSIDDFRTQDDYRNLTRQFSSVRNLLAEITVVDIHVANGDLSNYEAATLYLAILNDQLDVMIPKTNAINVRDAQKPVKEALVSILSYDLALYLQNISAALKSGSTDTVAQALAYRDKAFATYGIIEESLKEISQRIHMNDDDYYKWELSKSVLEKDSTAILNQEGGESGE